jgi:hypothetical protein
MMNPESMDFIIISFNLLAPLHLAPLEQHL